MTPRTQKALAVTAGLLVLGALLIVFLPRHGSPPDSRDLPKPPSITLTDVSIVDRALEKLDWGNIVFSAPAELALAQTGSAKALLSPSLSLEELQHGLSQTARSGTVEIARVRISNRMEARLTGAGFTIVPEAESLQGVASSQPTEWRWAITPTSSGIQTLSLSLYARVDVAGHDTPVQIRTYRRDVNVNVPISDALSSFLSNNWQWGFTTLLIPLAVAWRKRRQRAEAEQQTPSA